MISPKQCEDLEQVIIYSGLFKRVSFGDNANFLFKTVSHRESSYVSFITGVESDSLEALFKDVSEGKKNQFLLIKNYISYYLAHATVLVNENPVLTDRVNNLKLLKDYFYILPFDLTYLTFSKLFELKTREYELVPFLEEFCDTSFAKINFDMLLQHSLNSPQFTGIPGSDNVPVSHIQLLFFSTMKAISEKESLERNLFPFKFIAGLLSGKAVQQLENAFLREKIAKILEKRGTDNNVYGNPITIEGMIRQLKGMVSGEDDIVDQFVKEEERRSYESWKEDYLSKFRNIDTSIKTIGDVELPDLSEEALLKRYIKEYRFSEWLLKEYYDSQNNKE